MIDFSKITKTVTGLDCYYLGQRRSAGQVLHRFAVVNDAAELICYYNEQGQRIEFSGADGWVVQNGSYQIIAPPKIVEVTRWIGLFWDDSEYELHSATDENSFSSLVIAKQQHTFRFEVPNV